MTRRDETAGVDAGRPTPGRLRFPGRAVLFIFFVFVASALGATCPARAEPYLGLRTGRPCSACHVNITGGGMRNAHGVAYGLESMPWAPAPPASQDPMFYRGRVADAFYIGSDLRPAHRSTFTFSDNTNEFEVQTGSLYADLQLVSGRLHLYFDEHVASGGARSREAFALMDGLPGRIYVKAGRFFAPFGWRLLDDKAFIRSSTGYNFNSPDDGVEIGWTPGRLSSSLAVTNGNGGASEADDNKRVSLLSAWTSDRFRAGVSGSINRTDSESRQLAGALLGARFGPVVLLGELDAGVSEFLTGTPPPGSIDTTVRQLIGYAEADWLVHQGFNLKAQFDYLDPDRSQEGDEVNRAGGGIEVTPSPYIQLRLLWHRTDRPGEVRGVTYEDEREIVAELHLYL